MFWVGLCRFYWSIKVTIRLSSERPFIWLLLNSKKSIYFSKARLYSMCNFVDILTRLELGPIKHCLQGFELDYKFSFSLYQIDIQLSFCPCIVQIQIWSLLIIAVYLLVIMLFRAGPTFVMNYYKSVHFCQQSYFTFTCLHQNIIIIVLCLSLIHIWRCRRRG